MTEEEIRTERKPSTTRALVPELARVLLVDDDPTSRLTVQTILEAGGYYVDSAASAAEAYVKLEKRQFELVLSDVGIESPTSGYEVLAHARAMTYRPATAILTSFYEGSNEPGKRCLVEPEDVPGLLTKIANLIGSRASRKVSRELLLQGTN
jgi:CheY-like chemotaxis protein